jgi:hypothetical protein
MLKKDFLLQLIASLSANEKRYFKLFSGLQPGDKQFMRLFDALENEERYNLKKLSAELGRTTKQLTDDKYYLQQMLLRCLRSFEEQSGDHSAQHIIHINRADVQLLANRRLNDHVIELADKTIAKALECEMFETANQILYVKFTALFNLERFDEIPGNMDEYDRVLKIMSELNSLNRLRSEASAVERKGNGEQEVKNILAQPLLKIKPENLLSLKAQISWFEIMLRCHHATGTPDIAKGLDIARMQVRLFEKNTGIRQMNPLALVMAYDFLANSELLAGNSAAALDVLQKGIEMGNDPGVNFSKATRKAFNEHFIAVRTLTLYRLQRFDETITEAEKSTSYLVQRSAYEQVTVLFYHAMALLNTRRSDLALEKLNQLLQINTEDRIELQKYARAAMALAQLDMGNYQVVPYLIKSAKAWMKTRKITDNEVSAFLSHAYSIAMAPETEKRKNWLKLRDTKTAGQMKALDKELHLKLWLENKLARRA